MTFRDWCYKYIRDYKKIGLKRSTYDSYLNYAKHINIDIDLVDVGIMDIQAVVTEMYNGGLSYSTIKHTLTIMRQAYNKAYILRLVTASIPFNQLDMPKPRGGAVTALTNNEARLLIDGPNSHYKDLFLFLLYSGARVGEAIALRAGDIDFKNQCITIKHTDYHGELQPTKSNRERVIPLSPTLINILRRHMYIDPGARVFRNTHGGNVCYSTVRDAWRRYAAACGVRRCGLHVLRHSFATLSIQAGANIKAVSQLLGHSDISITLNIYTDINPKQRLDALGRLESLLSGNESAALVV